ncbi:histone RNA hairpin-binding protein [Phlebotomus argentipes]|uniref:histone RNA hairpin-binding protein n=1 Tax=Phlebotomus argentipes TaxID=94469 RepID=UPI0028934AC6|nr:histone RNA hairpin-binding protein [Phlebotomus argentipes]
MESEVMSVDSLLKDSQSPASKEKKIELLNRSWVDVMEEEEAARTLAKEQATRESQNEKATEETEEPESAERQDVYEVVDEVGYNQEDFLDIDENSMDLSDDKRNIEIDFLDRENEKKFDKLVKEEKIKTPFKRRFSGESIQEGGTEATESKRKKDTTHRVRSTSNSSGSTNNSGNTKMKREYESDPEILMRRQKQIDFGKNTIGYDNYINQVPKAERASTDPNTPQKRFKYSRRAWDGLIKQWRKQLHAWDTNNDEEKEAEADMET